MLAATLADAATQILLGQSAVFSGPFGVALQGFNPGARAHRRQLPLRRCWLGYPCRSKTPLLKSDTVRARRRTRPTSCVPLAAAKPPAGEHLGPVGMSRIAVAYLAHPGPGDAGGAESRDSHPGHRRRCHRIALRAATCRFRRPLSPRLWGSTAETQGPHGRGALPAAAINRDASGSAQHPSASETCS